MSHLTHFWGGYLENNVKYDLDVNTQIKAALKVQWFVHSYVAALDKYGNLWHLYIIVRSLSGVRVTLLLAGVIYSMHVQLCYLGTRLVQQV